MRKAFENALLTVPMVIGATIATAMLTALAMVLSGAMSDSGGALTGMSAALAAVMAGGLTGLLLSIVSLFIAAVTMPPAIGVMRLFKLPRPLFDIFGGAAAALLCAALILGLMESLARAKGGGLPSADARFIFDVCALLGGGALGYARHAWLVRLPQAIPVQPSVHAPEGGLAEPR